MPYDEFEYHFARSLLIPISWKKEEYKTARLLGATLRASHKECFNDYLAEIPEDDEELIKQAQDFIDKGKK